MADKKIIFVTVEGGIATVDEKTVPEGYEVRVLDFDSLKNDIASFEEELDDKDREYLKDRHPSEFNKVQDYLGDPDADEDDGDEYFDPDEGSEEEEEEDDDDGE